MHTNVITFTASNRQSAANDDHPAGPGGTVVSLSAFRRKARVVRTLRGVFFVAGGAGLVQAA